MEISHRGGANISQTNTPRRSPWSAFLCGTCSTEVRGNKSYPTPVRGSFDHAMRLVRLIGSSVDNGSVKLFSDAFLSIAPLLILPSD
jgi:hypothetical protein